MTDAAPHPPAEFLAQFSIASKAAAAVGWQAGYAEAMKAVGFLDPHVRVEPCRRFGAPHVRGVSVEAITGMVWAGESVDVVADEYGMRREDVLVACWYAGTLGSKQYRRAWGDWAKAAHDAMWRADRDYDAIPDPPSRDEMLRT